MNFRESNESQDEDCLDMCGLSPENNDDLYLTVTISARQTRTSKVAYCTLYK